MFEVASVSFVDPEVDPHVMLATVEGAANWYDAIFPSIPFDTTAALTVNIVSFVNPVIVSAWVAAVVVTPELPRNTNAELPPLGAGLNVVATVLKVDARPKLLNDGVTFADGFVRETVTLHVPTVNPYDKFLRPPENIHWIAVVP